MLSQGQAFGGTDIEDGQVGDDLPHAAGTGQGERAFWRSQLAMRTNCTMGWTWLLTRQDLGVALLVGVFLESMHVSSALFR